MVTRKRPRKSWTRARAGLICERICGTPFGQEISIATFICGSSSASLFLLAKQEQAPQGSHFEDFHRNGGSAKLSEPRRRASGAGLGAAGAFRASWDNSFSTYVIALGPKSRTHREILSVSLSRRKVLELPLQFTANDCAQVRAPTSAAAEPSHAAPPNSCPRPEFTPLCALSSRTGPAGVLLFYIGIPGRLSRPQRPHQQALEWRVAYGGR